MNTQDVQLDSRVAALKVWRKYRGLSVAQVAEKVSLLRGKIDCRRQVSAIFSGKVPMSDEYFTTLKTVLDIPDDDMLYRDPNPNSGPPWPVHRIKCDDYQAYFRNKVVDLPEEEMLTGTQFPTFLRDISTICEQDLGEAAAASRLLGINRQKLSALDEYVDVRDLLSVIYTTNLKPYQLPIRKQACIALREILASLSWSPKPTGNLWTWLATSHNTLKQNDAFAYQGVREKYSIVSARMLSALGKPERTRIRERAAEHNEAMLDHLSKKDPSYLESAVLSHVAFHLELIPGYPEAFIGDLKLALRGCTEKAMKNESMLVTFKLQHRELLQLLDEEVLEYEELFCWYQREQVFSLVPIFSQLLQAG